ADQLGHLLLAEPQHDPPLANSVAYVAVGDGRPVGRLVHGGPGFSASRFLNQAPSFPSSRGEKQGFPPFPLVILEPIYAPYSFLTRSILHLCAVKPGCPPVALG